MKRTTDIMFGGKQVLVCGYGEVCENLPFVFEDLQFICSQILLMMDLIKNSTLPKTLLMASTRKENIMLVGSYFSHS